MRVAPSTEHCQRDLLNSAESEFSQAMIMDPATVYAVPPRVAKSTFIESTMFLK